jgi:hypothetical protein
MVIMTARGFLGGALVVVLAVVIACGGGGDGEEPIQSTIPPGSGATGTPSGTAAATPTASSPVDGQLRGMVLQPSDLPPGLSQASESFSTNEEVAGAGGDATETLARLLEWGRIRGHGVVYSSENSDEAGVLLVDSTVSLYQNDTGASASFADAVETARATDWASVVAEATDVQVEELPALDVGDEMLWMRITGKAVIGDPAAEQSFIQDVVLMRVGRVRGSISTISASADAAPLVEGMVRAQAEHMAAGQ